MNTFETIFTTDYSRSVYDSVRYGYQYRKISESCNSCFNFCIPDPSPVLLWIAGSIASGIVYDVVKNRCKKLLKYIKDKKVSVEKDVETILSDDGSLKEFTIYIEEYNSHRMSITDVQEKYIKEEVFADAFAEESRELRKELKHTMLTQEEEMYVTKIAIKRADELIGREQSEL